MVVRIQISFKTIKLGNLKGKKIILQQSNSVKHSFTDSSLAQVQERRTRKLENQYVVIIGEKFYYFFQDHHTPGKMGNPNKEKSK